VGKKAAESSFRFEPTKVDKILSPGVAPSGMVWISGGDFSIGSEDARVLAQLSTALSPLLKSKRKKTGD